MQDLDELDDLERMRKRFRTAEELDKSNRDAAADAIRFYFGDQWAADIERQRKADGRPCFTLNKLPAILKQVLNEVRTRRPAIQISPMGGKASEKSANAIQGLTRHVENNADGISAYEAAFTYMVIGGFGSWEITHDYLPMSFDQDLFLGGMLDPFSVYWGPSRKLDKSDAMYCFVTSDYDAETLEAEFPDTELAGRSDFRGLFDLAPGWSSNDSIRVAKYYYIETEDSELVQLTDGRTMWWDDMQPGDRIRTDAKGDPVARKDKRRRAYLGITNGVEWLQKPKELPTDDIPVVTIYGDELMVDGELRFKGMLYDVMQAQQMFNYNSSAIAETMALGSKANWVATVEQIEPFLALWQQANNRNMAVLPYKNVPGVAAPQKISTEPPIQAMSAARLQAADDLRSISGVYDPTQSPNGGEESGRAIIARRRQALSSNSNWTKQLQRGIRRTALILMKYFPKIYDTPRVMRITGDDQKTQRVMFHAGADPQDLPAPEQAKADGIDGIFDLTVGEYDIAVSVGNEETRRQESLEMLISLCAAAPNLTPLIADFIVSEMDFPNKQAVVDRLQRALPPNLQDNQNPTDPAQLASHNAMLMSQNQALMQQVQKLTQIQQTKAIEGASRERVEAMKLKSAQVSSNAHLDAERVKAQASILVHAADQHFDAVHDHAMADKAHQHGIHAAVVNRAIAPPAAAPAGGSQ
jgi:hypothetical protein